MSLRPPERFAPAGSAHDLLDYEIAAEKAAALGRVGRKAEVVLSRLREGAGERQVLLGEAAEAVYAYFPARTLRHAPARGGDPVLRHPENGVGTARRENMNARR
jgi:hypothetical protein